MAYICKFSKSKGWHFKRQIARAVRHFTTAELKELLRDYSNLAHLRVAYEMKLKKDKKCG